MRWLLLLLIVGCGPRAQPVVKEPIVQAPDFTRPAFPSVLRFRSEGEGIAIDPPGTKAAARATVDGESYGWFLLVFTSNSILPGSYQTSDDGRRIEFGVEKGPSYVILLSVVSAGKIAGTYQRVWKHGEPDPDPDPDPDLKDLEKLAFDWAMAMGPEARAQATRIGGNLQLIGAKLAAGGYAGSDWAAKTNAAIIELRTLNSPRHADWDGWQRKWDGEMNKRLDDGRIKETVASVGNSFVQVGNGLVKVK